MVLLRLLLSLVVFANAGPSVDQLRSVHTTKSGRQAYDGGTLAPSMAVRLGSKRPGTKTNPVVTAVNPDASEKRSAVKSVPSVHAAKKLNLPKGTYGAAPPHISWDWDRTVMGASAGLAGAAIGFMLGGPIGAAVGFLAGFFVGVLVGKVTGVGT